MSDEASIHSVLSTLCPLADPDSGTLMGFDGRLWPADAPSTMTALDMLAPPALNALEATFPSASPGARHQIGEAVGMLASTVADRPAYAGAAREGARLRFEEACLVLSANVSNTLAYREILDSICDGGDRLRDVALPVALKAFEDGALPRPPEDDGEDTEAFALASLPQIDYLVTDADLRERAGAFLMAFVVAHQSGIPYSGWACMDEPADPIAAYARKHLDNPKQWADTVREQGTLDPAVLVAADSVWGA